MKRIRIMHVTRYHYRTPVFFGPHRALIRPREGHDLHIAGSRLEIEPAASVRWYRDIYGNSIAIITFTGPARSLSLSSQMDVDLYEDTPSIPSPSLIRSSTGRMSRWKSRCS